MVRRFGSIPAYACLAALFAFACACSKDATKSSPQPSASTSVQSGLGAAPPASASNDPGPPPPKNLASIPERFELEAKSRPTGTPRVEDVLAAFTKAGVELRETRQHLGAPFKAEYCVGSKAGKDLHMSICEYKDEKIATEGKAMSAKAFAAVGNRELFQNRATTLTIRRGDGDPGDLALKEKLVGLFDKVEPPPAPAQPAEGAKQPAAAASK